MLLPKMYGAILSPFSPALNESGADGERGEIIAHPGTFLLWVSWVFGGILSRGLIARSPCSCLERGVAVSGEGMLLDGLRSILSPPVFGGGGAVMEGRA